MKVDVIKWNYEVLRLEGKCQKQQAAKDGDVHPGLCLTFHKNHKPPDAPRVQVMLQRYLPYTLPSLAGGVFKRTRLPLPERAHLLDAGKS